MHQDMNTVGRSREVAAALVVGLLVAACTSAAPAQTGQPGGGVSPTSAATTAPSATAPSATAPSATAPAPETDGIAGAWSGTWTRTAPEPGEGDMTLDLTVVGDPADGPQAVNGSMTVTGSACLADESISGVLIGSQLQLVAHDDGRGMEASWTGTVNGGRIEGQMTVTCGNVTGTGTWQVARP